MQTSVWLFCLIDLKKIVTSFNHACESSSQALLFDVRVIVVASFVFKFVLLHVIYCLNLSGRSSVLIDLLLIGLS